MRLRSRTTAFAVGIGMILVLAGCTREVAKKTTMTLSFNSSSGNSAYSLNGKLNFAAVNVHLPTGPLLKEFDFEDNPIPAGQGFTLEVPNVPTGSFLVQFLGVYEVDGQASKFVYGDNVAIVALGATNEVSISPAEMGSFTKEGRVSGRYFSSASTPFGPTGDLIMQFQPPDLTKPKMNVHHFPIVQGWFSILALDGAKMDYALTSTKEVILKGVRLVGSDLEIDGVLQTTGSHLAKFAAPAHYMYESGDGDIRSIPPSEVWVGFFKKSTVSSSVLSGKQVCFANDVEEALPRAYLNYSAGTLSSPLEVDLVTGSASEVRRVSGGVGATLENLYTDTGVGCTATGANRMIVYHNMLGDEGDRAAGINPPFQAIRPHARWDHYMAASYSEPSGNPTITIAWKFIPGLDGSELTGVSVLGKKSNGSYYYGGDKSCIDLLAQGFSEIGSTNNLVTEEYLFSYPTLNAEMYQWSFALCAYKNSGGIKQYVGRPIRGGHLGSGMENQLHLGWAPASRSLTASAADYDYEFLGGENYKLSSVNNAGSSLYTALTVVGSTNLVPGDEVMFTIVGMNPSCGSFNSQTNFVGKYEFARVLAATASTIKIPKGTFLDQLETHNAILSESDYANSFCHIQVGKVLQYRDLNLTAATNFTTAPSTNPDFNYSGTIMSQIPIRVNGVLSLGAMINVTGGGFAGGTGSASTGAGSMGPSKVSGANGTGGQGNMPNGAGGASYGSGGAGGGPAVSTPGLAGSVNGLSYMLLGGGGGHGNASNGGSGGGNIFIVARETQVTGSSEILADGNGGSGFEGGGGGGGSVTFYTGKISGAGTLALSAQGGDGAVSAGVGGGGSVQALACIGTTTMFLNAAKGVVGGTSGATDGMAVQLLPSANSQSCQLLQ